MQLVKSTFALLGATRYNNHGLATRLYLPAQQPGADWNSELGVPALTIDYDGLW